MNGDDATICSSGASGSLIESTGSLVFYTSSPTKEIKDFAKEQIVRPDTDQISAVVTGILKQNHLNALRNLSRNTEQATNQFDHIFNPRKEEKEDLITPENGTLLDRKIEEARRSVFVAKVPDTVTRDQLSEAFGAFGNLQELIWIEKEKLRSAIIIFIDEETAYDALKETYIEVNGVFVSAEARRIQSKAYPPRIPMDEDARTVQLAAGGRGAPLSVVADSIHPQSTFGSLEGVVHGKKPDILDQGPGTQRRTIPLPTIPPVSKVRPTSANELDRLLKLLPFLSQEMSGAEQMEMLMKFLELNEEELKKREKTRHDLEFEYRKIFRNSSVRLYGSSVNTFGVRGSDVDAFLDLHLDTREAKKDVPVREGGVNRYLKKISHLFCQPYEPAEVARFSKQDILKLMTCLMRFRGKRYQWDTVFAIPEARTPILKLGQSVSGYSIDISFTSPMVFQNTGLLIMYSHYDPRLRPLVYTVRRWADSKELCGDRGFTKYALTMLVIFFLMRIEVLPTPQRIANYLTDYLKKERPDLVDPFQFDHGVIQLRKFAEMLPSPGHPGRSPAELLVEFFRFYDSFSGSFCHNVLDCLTGQIIPVSNFPNSDDAFRTRYVNIQDPFDRAHNIAKTVTMKTFLHMRDVIHREAVIFSAQPLDLKVLLVNHPSVEEGRCSVVAVSGAKATVSAEIWMPKAAVLVGKILKDFFCCNVKELSAEDSSRLPFNRRLMDLGPILKDISCYLTSLTWLKRRNERQRLTKKRKYVGLTSEWDLESDIGKKIAEGTEGKVDIDFFVTVMVNKFEMDRMCIFLTTQQNSPEALDLFDFLEKFLPEQARRFLKLEEIVIEPATDGSNEQQGDREIVTENGNTDATDPESASTD